MMRALGSTYTSDWADLDMRPCPEWFRNAKFGIFIHWGLYSVPAWAPRGEYAEWYWRSAVDAKSDSPWRLFHEAHFGSNFGYEQFAPQFRAELFDPHLWGQCFAGSGAKYVVLTSKHHDGFCLWPSAQASRNWNRPWNSVDTGPRRDLVGDLRSSVISAGLRFGLYFSLYEWFNPLWREDRDAYVEQHLFPQFRDLVIRYEPSLIFADGEWDMPSARWRSAELLSWLFNRPQSADVVINDRWGADTRHKHGGYFTTEYGAGLPDSSHPWEENRGVGSSFGYNRAELATDYKSARELVLMLCDIVSRGGNLLLNVGPAADGRIPSLMQSVLVEIGDWLKCNGEAVYDSRPAAVDCQWSAGQRPTQGYGAYKVPYDISRLAGPAQTPDGRAVKQLFFTQKGENLYAITSGWLSPAVCINEISVTPETEVVLLGRESRLSWTHDQGVLTIQAPSLAPQDLPCRHAWAFRISPAHMRVAK